MITTAALAADQLRTLADALESLADMTMTAWVSFGVGYSSDEADRVAEVNTIAANLDMAAEPVLEHTVWQHLARETRDGVTIRVHTYIEGPSQRCVCGAACTHKSLAGVS
jgi:hypothetical protein